MDAVRERTRSGCVDGEGKGVRLEVGAAAIGNGRERELVSAQGGLRERMRCTQVGVAGGASLIVSRNKPVQASGGGNQVTKDRAEPVTASPKLPTAPDSHG